MREHKYRARWKDTGKVIPDFMDEYCLGHLNDDCLFIDEYTGIKDSNNTEGYEGDISEDFSTGEKFKIEFVDGAFTLVDKNGVGQEILDLQCQHIIGNIYTTPDLKEQS